MSNTLEQDYACPYCWFSVTETVKLDAGEEQTYIVDCEHCQKPIRILLKVNGPDLKYFEATKENDEEGNKDKEIITF
ncbi:MAG: CPXCG motif-containing cysteine-rich protein [Candidatus Omnitrophica bacterium]|nr:CPXCG motif-containing cysteine-rich protein [Candidatus Omnitrophota bacterium]MCB9747434.1 CPXCG motif-containing cysteine-rich protein [Candidatus Omnitrophota bacterium]